ncbi:MAG: hypothetical protein INQ03_13275 [Candidatus Heimdallarchaeota archaeon]|nr:hypothetical protein [Candidatus Heimdallarchaeota archaeon]
MAERNDDFVFSTEEDKPQGGVIDETGMFKRAGTGSLPDGSGPNLGKIVPILFLIVIISIPAAVINMNFDWTLDHVDTWEYEQGFANTTKVEILIDQVSGSVTISNDLDDDSNLYEITTEISANDEGKKVYDENSWSMTEEAGVMMLSFNDDIDYTFTTDVSVEYKHHIALHSGISITELDIHTVSGSIDAVFIDMEVTDVQFSTVSGSLDFALEDGVVTNEIDLSTTSGSIDVNIADSTIDCTSIRLDSTSGSVDLIFENSEFTQDCLIVAEVVSGSIDVDWIQQTLNYTIEMELSTVSGSISVDLELHNSISTEYDIDAGDDQDVPSEHTGTSGTISISASTTSSDIDIDYTELS